MDTHQGPHFKIPTSSFLVLSISIIGRFILPTWQNLSGRFPNALQQIAIGHILNVAGMVVFTLVQTKRLRAIRIHDLTVNLAPLQLNCSISDQNFVTKRASLLTKYL